MSDTPVVIGWDTETRRIGPGQVFPPVVCLQISCQQDTRVVCKCETESFNQLKAAVFDVNESWVRVAHSSTYDLMVMATHDPRLLPAIFDMLERGLFTCTKIREKLLNLTSHGNMEFLSQGDRNIKIEYSLADLVKNYFGVDLKSNKATTKVNTETGKLEVVGEEDAWRLNYEALEDMPVSEWPEEAVTYAADDGVWAEAVYWEQEKVRQQIIQNAGHDPFEVLPFKCSVDFVLALLTQRGMKTDPSRVAEVEAMLHEELAPEKMKLLLEHGIVRPAEPPRPYANNSKNHAPDCTDKKNCDCPPRMTAGVKESVNETKLKEYVRVLCENRPDIFTLKRTKPSKSHPEGQVSCDKDWLEDHAAFDPMLSEYQHRQNLQKLVSTYIPQMKWEGEVASTVHANFDVLKATGRTSSYGSKMYPSMNGQQVDPRIRRCYIPRAGHHLFSIDYTAMELGTFAQTCLNLFGFSKLAEIINSGKDPHAYLGAQIALATNEDFREVAMSECNEDDTDGMYELFSSLKEDPQTKALYKHYRTFAKPTGLGYPGGLAPKTFITFAKGSYGIDIDLATATQLKQVWLNLLPEAPLFFDHIKNNCIDELNGARKVVEEKFIKNDDGTVGVEKKEKWKERFRYMSPMGMWRMACDYCACCNGLALQTPSAEGATLGLYEVMKQSILPTGTLHGQLFPLLFIHDEILGEIKITTPEQQHRLLLQASEYMVESMQAVTPDVKAGAEPVLMTRWDKYVDPAYDENGYLVPVDPDN